jgi:hypothetical protein
LGSVVSRLDLRIDTGAQMAMNQIAGARILVTGGAGFVVARSWTSCFQRAPRKCAFWITSSAAVGITLPLPTPDGGQALK